MQITLVHFRLCKPHPHGLFMLFPTLVDLAGRKRKNNHEELKGPTKMFVIVRKMAARSSKKRCSILG